MEFSSKRVKIAKFIESDFDVFSQMRMCSEMMEHIYTPYTLKEASQQFNAFSAPWDKNSNGWLSFSIELLLSGEKVGNIGLKIKDHELKIGEVGFMVKKSAQGKGIASEALSLIKRFAFTELKLNKLEATCSTANKASFLLLEKHGFIKEEELKNNSVINGKAVNDFLYGLDKSTI